jgi:hypothetical protein
MNVTSLLVSGIHSIELGRLRTSGTKQLLMLQQAAALCERKLLMLRQLIVKETVQPMTPVSFRISFD